MKNFLTIFQIVVAILLLFTILSQEKGTGLSATFGGGGEFYRSKRGIDRLLFIITIILALLFVLSSLTHLYIT